MTNIAKGYDARIDCAFIDLETCTQFRGDEVISRASKDVPTGVLSNPCSDCGAHSRYDLQSDPLAPDDIFLREEIIGGQLVGDRLRTDCLGRSNIDDDLRSSLIEGLRNEGPQQTYNQADAAAQEDEPSPFEQGLDDVPERHCLTPPKRALKYARANDDKIESRHRASGFGLDHLISLSVSLLSCNLDLVA